MRTYKVEGTINGKPAEFSATVSGNYRDGSKDISCEIATDDCGRNVDAIDIYEDLAEVANPNDVVSWAENHGFKWRDEVNALPARRSVLLSVVAGDLGLEN